MELVQRHRTAMTRTFLSRPVQQLLADGLLEPGSTFFDYGCGRGGDVRHLLQLGYEAAGWDPAHAPAEEPRPAATVNLGFVINVIEDQKERREALQKAWRLTEDVLVVSARMEWEATGEAGRPYHDGFITKTGTFQKFYAQDELRAWIDSTLGQTSVAGAPGIFYIFRSETAQQRLLSRHTRTGGQGRLGVVELIYRRHRDLLDPLEAWVTLHRALPSPAELEGAEEIVRVFGSIRSAFGVIRRATGGPRWDGVELGGRKASEARFETHLMILQPLIDFLRERGRLPHDDELAEGGDIRSEFGSIRAAFSLVRRVAGTDMWADFEARAKQDFLVYLALAAFGGRPKFSDLPSDLQYDARDLCGNYKEACAQADKLLFAAGRQDALELACRASAIGKLTPEALYVHVSGLAKLPPVLRVYIGCAEMLTGKVSGATILKLHRQKPQVSFLSYPRFDQDAHPALTSSIVARFRELNVTYKDFASRNNPPILHRKETFVPVDYPGRTKFQKLTASEQERGLLNSPSIGTRDLWSGLLSEAGLEIRGHRLVKLSK